MKAPLEIIPPEMLRPEAEDAEEAKPDLATESLEASIPKAYRGLKFSAPHFAARISTPDSLQAARREWISRRICLTGPARAGKTSLGVAMLYAWAADGRRGAEFFHAYRLGVARIQHAAGHGEPEIVDRAMRAELALIDDLGSERDTANNAVPDVIFERHAEDRPTWVTTGLSRKQLTARYGAGIVGRLFERATVIRVGVMPKEEAAE